MVDYRVKIQYKEFVKDIFFLSGLPRAGNTLFGSIMNQNKDIAVTANSICADIIGQLYSLKKLDIFQNQLTLLSNYFKHLKAISVSKYNINATYDTIQPLETIEYDVKSHGVLRGMQFSFTETEVIVDENNVTVNTILNIVSDSTIELPLSVSYDVS